MCDEVLGQIKQPCCPVTFTVGLKEKQKLFLFLIQSFF